MANTPTQIIIVLHTSMEYSIEYWVERLNMQPHPEGGFYTETFRSSEQVTIVRDGQTVTRSAGTAIYFLVPSGTFSAFHRIKSDETWHFYAGDALSVLELLPDGSLTTHQLGNDPSKGQIFQTTILAGRWFASKVSDDVSHVHGYSLVGCTVAPGFDFADFELAKADELSQSFPAHEQVIRSLCRS